MNFCNQCGKKLNGGSFCTECGAPIKATAVQLPPSGFSEPESFAASPNEFVPVPPPIFPTPTTPTTPTLESAASEVAPVAEYVEPQSELFEFPTVSDLIEKVEKTEKVEKVEKIWTKEKHDNHEERREHKEKEGGESNEKHNNSFLGNLFGGHKNKDGKKGGLLSGFFNRGDNKDKDGGFLSNIELEDLILIAVIFFLLKDGFEDDLILILAIILFAS
ncbi:MAG: zinc ribbon domain-containing protein [Oscillospiraceae bacterium]|nr:zinc ribbon domain-containing protein [Oscillospiraceae bacterium]